MPLQDSWRFCTKCNEMFFDGYPDKGRCPGGGGHEAAGFVFLLPHDEPATPTAQRDWRYCGKCHSMFFDGYPHKGTCSAGGGHEAQGYMFVLPHDVGEHGGAQGAWRFCSRCHVMFYDGSPDKGRCAAGAGHAAAGHVFVLPHRDAPAPVPPAPDTCFENANNQKYWRYCHKCCGLFFDGYTEKGHCASGGAHEAAGYMFVLPHGVPGTAHGQEGWRFCHKCGGMFFDGYADKGRCAGGAAHAAAGYQFVLPHDLPGTATTQEAWRFCHRCHGMFFDGHPAKGACAAGGGHAAAGYMFVLPHDISQPFVFSAPVVTGGLAALGGHVSVTVELDGTVRWKGHLHNSGADNYDFGISAVLGTPSGRTVALARTGYVGGTLSSDSRDEDWEEVVTLPGAVTARMSEFAHGNLHTHLDYESGIGTTLEAIAGFMIRWTAGTALGPVGAAAFVGLQTASLIESGSLVPGARLASGILWLAGPANTLFALVADAIASAGSRARELSQEEYDWANEMVFQGALPPRERLVLTDTIGAGGRAFTFPRWDGAITLNMGPTAFDNPRAYGGEGDGRTYIHELVHACQIEHSSMDLSLMADALASRFCEVVGVDPYSYGRAGPDYTTFNLEQQAQIVSDWYAGNSSKPNTEHTGVRRDPNSPYFPYIAHHVRTGRF